jgi:gluconokinase
MGHRVVFMGVSGCGKSSLAAAVAAGLELPLVEGDDHHAEQSLEKMRRGFALTDADRRQWLAVLAGILQTRRRGVLLTCSALKLAYRQQLRAAAPGLRFVFLELARDEAQRRVEARAQGHFFPPGLVASQFATLESPVGEQGVLRVDAAAPIGELSAAVTRWLETGMPRALPAGERRALAADPGWPPVVPGRP